MVLTPSGRQLRHREVGWEGSRSAKHCTEEHKSPWFVTVVVGSYAGLAYFPGLLAYQTGTSAERYLRRRAELRCDREAALTMGSTDGMVRLLRLDGPGVFRAWASGPSTSTQRIPSTSIVSLRSNPLTFRPSRAV